ncbi:MAG: DEAD/DEAH box helicase [Acidimicrobiales bacterium]
MTGSRADFLRGLGFEPDGFQSTAMTSLDEGASVLVAAPTGSGKTLVAEYAIHRALGMGKRAFYTAPLKALSNQKFRDLSAKWGPDRVGLLTGDNAVNADAPVVVMTTEVLRNMIYSASSRLDSLGAVVLDEVHFLQDEYRGPVWEEVIIHLDPEVQLVCLSATVSNADEVGEWLTTVRGRTDVVVETRRPVELVTHHALFDREAGRVVMHDTIVNGSPNRGLERTLALQRQETARKGRPRRRFSAPNREELVELLDDGGMLPAIVFIFSRAQCEDAVRSCVDAGLILTTADEEDEIRAIVEQHASPLDRSDRAAIGYEEFLDQIGCGIASHHAGMIPLLKEAVEECFVRGLVKVVFATETLAVGINMPARAVVIEKLTKYTGEHHVLLRASEYTQLTGRAGRRGLDEIGHAVTLWNPYVSFDQTAALALSRSFRLSSAFRPTSNMVANMVRRHSREEAMHLLNLSFAQFQADRDVVTSEALLERKRRDLRRIEVAGGTSVDGGDGVADRRAPTDDGDSARTATEVEAEIALRALRPGDVVVFDCSNIRGRGLVISTSSRRSGTRLSVLTPSRKQIEVTSRDLLALPVRATAVELPVPYDPSRAEFVREAAVRLVKARVSETVAGRPVGAAVKRQQGRDDGARAERRLRKEINQLQQRASARAGSVAARFSDVAGMLEELGYLDGWSLTDKGRLLAGIFHESDLLVADVVSGGLLERLAPRDLASLLSALVYEPRAGHTTSVRWPNDTVRNRFRQLERVSNRLSETVASHGLQRHRDPHPGFAFDAHAWSNGRGLADIIDPEMTPGDFVRTVRQLVDLLRQVEQASPTAEVRDNAREAVVLLNRGVVAISAGVQG